MERERRGVNMADGRMEGDVEADGITQLVYLLKKMDRQEREQEVDRAKENARNSVRPNFIRILSADP